MRTNLFTSLAIIFLTIAMTACNKQVTPAQPAVDETKNRYYLSDFQPIRGTTILIAEVALDSDTWDPYSSARWFSFGDSGDARVHNLVFLNGQTLESHRLFPTNDTAILNATQFPEGWIDTYDTSSQSSDNVIPTEWFVYEIVTNDSNGDGKLNRDDLFIISLSDEDGAGYTEIMSGVNKVYGMNMIGHGKLVITYLQNDRKMVMLIDMASKTILDIKELIDLGEVVK